MYENVCVCCFGDMAGQRICPHCGNVESGTRKHMFLPARTVLQERYLIGETLSSDKNSMCYKALDLQTRRVVEIQEHFPREHVTRDRETQDLIPLEREGDRFPGKSVQTILQNARTVMRFADCGAVLRIYDVFPAHHTVYVVCEYLEGMTLEDYLDRNGTLDTDTALSILFPVLDALTRLHNAGLVHRAVTPKNIVLTSDNTVKLIRFDFLRATSAHEESDMTVYFSPGYTPYEQYVRRERRGPYTDIYSAGAVLFRMLCGQTPPDAVSRKAADTLGDLLEASALPAYLDRVIGKAMRMDQDDRFRSAADFKSALLQENETAVFGGTIGTHTESRKKRIIGAVIAILAVLAVGLALVVYWNL